VTTNSSRPEISLVYLAWRPYGVETFARFVDSYRKYRSGMAHHLTIAFKGFGAESELAEYEGQLAGIDYGRLVVPDEGYDIGTYLLVASRIASPFYCFMNTKSVILAQDWLAIFHQFARDPRVGAVGATASCESLYTDYLEQRAAPAPGTPAWRLLARRSPVNRLRHLYLYPPYPNPHLRTNAFMIRQDVLASVRTRRIRNRLDTSRFENGREGLSRQLFGRGLDVLVAGRDGVAYRSSEWRKSRTFWQYEQENLLIGDNQTEKYALADARQRELLRERAWGVEEN
jgi:hypothetical protein